MCAVFAPRHVNGPNLFARRMSDHNRGMMLDDDDGTFYECDPRPRLPLRALEHTWTGLHGEVLHEAHQATCQAALAAATAGTMDLHQATEEGLLSLWRAWRSSEGGLALPLSKSPQVATLDLCGTGLRGSGSKGAADAVPAEALFSDEGVEGLALPFGGSAVLQRVLWADLAADDDWELDEAEADFFPGEVGCAILLDKAPQLATRDHREKGQGRGPFVASERPRSGVPGAVSDAAPARPSAPCAGPRSRPSWATKTHLGARRRAGFRSRAAAAPVALVLVAAELPRPPEDLASGVNAEKLEHASDQMLDRVARDYPDVLLDLIGKDLLDRLRPLPQSSAILGHDGQEDLASAVGFSDSGGVYGARGAGGPNGTAGQVSRDGIDGDRGPRGPASVVGRDAVVGVKSSKSYRGAGCVQGHSPCGSSRGHSCRVHGQGR